MTAAPKLMTLPDVSRATGLSLDLLRKHRPQLEAEGLVTRLGSYWVAEAANVSAIADRVRLKAMPAAAVAVA